MTLELLSRSDQHTVTRVTSRKSNCWLVLKKTSVFLNCFSVGVTEAIDKASQLEEASSVLSLFNCF